ncbi:protein SLOW GREEN 1, chloroplastic [Prosopis cineraria]|uniref:protein SLOW GREEN 1, chloroplastic n=1 Tax=Prosopis cineraria TaxID=364024 RepID=UPI00240FB99B|nr:protein SLOW GREEN 1, chloroplastic [Prosopis cineraria]
MSSTFATASSSSSSSSLFPFNFNSSKPPSPRHLRFPSPLLPTSPSISRFSVRACSPNGPARDGGSCLVALKRFAGAAVLFAASAAMIGKSFHLPARAESPVSVAEQAQVLEEEKEGDRGKQRDETSSPLSEFLETNAEAVDALKSLLQQKLENGDDEEALKILKRMVSAQPEETEWKFLMARLLSEMGDHENARDLYEQVLAVNPLSFEALFENALLMDRCGEGEEVVKRLEEALRIAEEKNKAKEARDVRLIMAQIQFLQKNVEEAMSMYQQLTKEDPSDFRPYFCRGMIYSLLDKNEEAREQFAKYRELSPKKFEVEGYLRSPLSRLKLFGTDEN